VRSDGDVDDDDNEGKVGHGKVTMIMAKVQGKSFYYYSKCGRKGSKNL
jgi:hypothetical protein